MTDGDACFLPDWDACVGLLARASSPVRGIGLLHPPASSPYSLFAIRSPGGPSRDAGCNSEAAGWIDPAAVFFARARVERARSVRKITLKKKTKVYPPTKKKAGSGIVGGRRKSTTRIGSEQDVSMSDMQGREYWTAPSARAEYSNHTRSTSGVSTRSAVRTAAQNTTGISATSSLTPQPSSTQSVLATNEQRQTVSAMQPTGTSIVMPLPGTKGAPKFKGARVTDFVNDFATCAKAAGIPDAEWPNQCLRYCANNVRRVIKHLHEFRPTASDWDAAKAKLLQLYGSTDEESKFRPSKLRKFYRAARGRRMTTVQQFDKYFREFLETLGDMTETKMVTEKERDLYFYKGIPQRARQKIRAKLEKAGVVVEMRSPPPMEKTVEQAKSLFGGEDVNEDSDDSEGSSDETSRDDSSGSDRSSDSEDSEPRSKKKKHRKSKETTRSQVELKVKHEAPSDSESKQVLEHAKSLADRFEKLMAFTMNQQVPAQTSVNAQCTQTGNCSHMLGQRTARKCWMCDKTEGIDLDHGIGIKSCPETIKLVEEGLIKLGSTGRLVKPDGSELPRALPGQGGIARVLRNDAKLRARSDPSKKDAPPHMNVAVMGLCRDGEHVLKGGVFAIASESAHSFPIQTRSAKQKRVTTCEEVDEDKEVVKEVCFEELPMEVVKASGKKTAAQEKGSAGMRPPVVNTEEGWRERERRKREARGEKRDAEQSDSVQIEEVQAQLLATKVTLPLRDIIGLSPELQKRFASLTKTRREVGARAIVTEFTDDGEVSVTTEDEEERDGLQGKTNSGQPGAALLTYDTTEDLGAILQRYTAAVSLRSKHFFAMATGFVEARFGGEHVIFLIDTGSELNLISRRVWEQTDVPIDKDGARWSLRGISGEPVKLLGCCREAPLEIDRSRFDHHFFVSTQETGVHDGILGQPWFHWFSCRVDYDRFGTMEVEAWPTGVKTDKSIKLRAAGIDPARNADRLVLAAASEWPSESGEGMRQGRVSVVEARLGKTLEKIVDPSRCQSADELLLVSQLFPPRSYDYLLQTVRATLPRSEPVASAWVSRAFAVYEGSVSGTRYKPVSKKVRPVPTSMPNLSAQKFKAIMVGELPSLTTNPSPWRKFEGSERISRGQLEEIIATVPEGFLSEAELDLMAHVVIKNEKAIAFTDAQRGTFSREYFPDYQIPHIEHMPWQRPIIKIPKALEDDVCRLITEQRNAKYLKQMIREPDLPNAPMTRWVAYIQLFDLYLNHVPAANHAAEDGLSRRRPSPEDSSESDGEDELERRIGAAAVAFGHLRSKYDRRAARAAIVRDAASRSGGGDTMVDTPADPAEPFCIHVSSLADFELQRATAIRDSDGSDGVPANIVCGLPQWYLKSQWVLASGLREFRWHQVDAEDFPSHPGLLRNEDDVNYIGQEFMWRRVARCRVEEVELGGEVARLEIVEYRPAFAIDDSRTTGSGVPYREFGLGPHQFTFPGDTAAQA
ncbi:hypothetical protein CERSUDRAFT_73522 [Gelatoporia subvermispora B]|uniref:Peptidase A2 domain-containing protein n=1 Tax=Ceriporiopsis subvermispora (strain B) TaxID=914234 RepID=M2RFS2_CERS8|nr:hypothetical protein CERSUDRAFT_73522 [Gelatoporia subvermispora B]